MTTHKEEIKLAPYCPIAFGESGIQALRYWLKKACLGGREVWPVTDLETWMDCPRPDECCGRPGSPIKRWGVADLKNLPDTSQPLHRKGWLTARAHEMFAHVNEGPVILCDTDWFPLSPIPFEEMCRDAWIGLCRDVGRRTYTGRRGFRWEEMNSGLIWLNDLSFGSLYSACWESPDIQDIRDSGIPYVDQICTSRMFFEGDYGAPGERIVMPEEWNWSHLKEYKPDSGILGVHFHGGGKAKIPGFFAEHGGQYGK